MTNAILKGCGQTSHMASRHHHACEKGKLCYECEAKATQRLSDFREFLNRINKNKDDLNDDLLDMRDYISSEISKLEGAGIK